MKKIELCLIGLIVVLVFTQIAVTSSEVSSFDYMADVNRDRVIDVYDLARLAEAYGTTQTLPTQPNQTVVYVYQLETDPPEVENARVAIVDPNYDSQPLAQAVQIAYTNSSGLANFTTSPNSDYTVIAWSNTTCNYANLTTNDYGEASVAIQLGYPQLPNNWVVLTFLNKTSGALAPLYWRTTVFTIEELTYQQSSPPVWTTTLVTHLFAEEFNGMLVIGPWHLEEPFDPSKNYGVYVWDDTGGPLVTLVYKVDENGSANVITYV